MFPFSSQHNLSLWSYLPRLHGHGHSQLETRQHVSHGIHLFALYKSSLAFLLSLWKPLLFFSYFLLPLDVQLEGLIALSEVGVKHSSLGMSSSFAHSVTHSPSCCIKRGCTVTKTDLEIPLPPVAYAPPLSKTQRPIFRTLSDKHDLLVDPSLLRRMPTGRWVVEYLGSWQVCGCRINNLKDLDHAQ